MADPLECHGTYLLDFYHVCDYLSAEEKSIIAEPAGQKPGWTRKKAPTGDKSVDELIEALAKYREAPCVDDSKATVRQCHRYLSQRRKQLHYQSAMARDLPIGSGEIERTHRYIVQQRFIDSKA